MRWLHRGAALLCATLRLRLRLCRSGHSGCRQHHSARPAGHQRRGARNGWLCRAARGVVCGWVSGQAGGPVGWRKRVLVWTSACRGGFCAVRHRAACSSPHRRLGPIGWHHAICPRRHPCDALLARAADIAAPAPRGAPATHGAPPTTDGDPRARAVPATCARVTTTHAHTPTQPTSPLEPLTCAIAHGTPTLTCDCHTATLTCPVTCPTSQPRSSAVADT